MKLRFVSSMVRRELRSAGRRLGFYGSCMAIGIAVVGGLHSPREPGAGAVRSMRCRERALAARLQSGMARARR